MAITKDSKNIKKVTDSDGTIVVSPAINELTADRAAGINIKNNSGDTPVILAAGTTPIKYNDSVYTDLAFSATQTRRGANNKPDYDLTNLGLLFPQDDAEEKVYIILQMDHRKKLETNIDFHIHYIQSEATQPTFTLEYKFYSNNSTVPGSWTTISTSDGTGEKGRFEYSSGDLLQVAEFPEIVAPTGESLSAILDIILYRNDNDLTGDVLVKFMDAHYQIDTAGSADEYVK